MGIHVDTIHQVVIGMILALVEEQQPLVLFLVHKPDVKNNLVAHGAQLQGRVQEP